MQLSLVRFQIEKKRQRETLLWFNENEASCLQMDFAFVLSVTQDLYKFDHFLCQYAHCKNKHSAVQYSPYE